MSEDPIKLFDSRADRLPQADDGDRVAETTKRLIGHMPLVNIIADIVVPQFWVSGLDRRRHEWLKDLADVVEQLKPTRVRSRCRREASSAPTGHS